jgi:hypothetical protein
MDKIKVDTSKVETRNIASEIDAMQTLSIGERRRYSRKWYDNNFFDDGFHFRYISPTTGRIVSEKESTTSPKRVIPKASRQIRGMANLVLSQDFVPVVKPERVNKYSYADPQQYAEAQKQAKLMAKRVGHWLENEWHDEDLREKLIQMVLLTLKHGVSFIQVWPDAVEEKIQTTVYDAFDIYLSANHDSIYDSPFIGKAIPRSIREIKANENFDKGQLEMISPDNKYASDEIKEAYLHSKYGAMNQPSDANATLILKEWFIKETLNEVNMALIKQQENAEDILRNRNLGDTVIRQVFCAGGIWLKDSYLDLPEYPFVDLRWEPGPIYQVAPMERFISANKSLDTITARLETFLHTMNVGVWLKRKGEEFKISNVGGGLIAEYSQTPPQQMPLSSPPPAIFNFIELLNSFIEEQGVSTSALGKIPSGVKAWHAIESLKQSEYANLYTPLQQVKKCVQRISEKMLDISANYFTSLQEVPHMDQGEPDYFDVIGEAGAKTREEIGTGVPQDTVVLKKDYKVEIEVESGLAFTDEGKKGRMMEIMDYMVQLSQAGIVDPVVLKEAMKKMLEIYQFGPTETMMEALDNPPSMDETQMQQMKVAMAETLKDVGYQPPMSDEERDAQTKLSMAQVLKDSGLLNKQEPQQTEEPSQSISFRDLPPEGKAQLAAKAGIQITPQEVKKQELQVKSNNATKAGKK